jgi:mannose-1-phosphate guanylyltransferase
MSEATTFMDQNSVKEFSGFIGGGQTKKRAAIILAGGEGSRLRSLTKMISGDDRPKQFCPIIAGETLLDATRTRIARTFRPDEIYFSLTARHEKYFNRLLWNVRADKKVVQPENKGTAPAILYSVLRVAVESPDATIAIFPSDHYFSNDEIFMSHVETAFGSIEREQQSVVLLGIEPDKPEASYGWIEPADSLFGSMSGSISRVNRFWEKPTVGVAKQLMSAGCLWNSFVMIGKASAFIEMFKEHSPELFRMFAAASRAFGRADERTVIRSIYSWIDDVNFSSEVLERSCDRLLVKRVSDVTWSDLGEPQRVVGALNNIGIQTEWMQALAA